MKFRVIAWLLLVVLMAFGLFSAQSLLEQRTLAEKTVRLHVVANSDSDADQAQKLRVRDAVLQCAGALTAQCSDAAEARSVLAAHLPEIEQAASNHHVALTPEMSERMLAHLTGELEKLEEEGK